MRGSHCQQVFLSRLPPIFNDVPPREQLQGTGGVGTSLATSGVESSNTLLVCCGTRVLSEQCFYLHVGTMFCCKTMGYKIKQCRAKLCVVILCMLHQPWVERIEFFFFFLPHVCFALELDFMVSACSVVKAL